MTRSPDTDGLQLEEDLAHQRREWRVQRIGWIAMALIAAAALAGLLGPGPLSHARAGDPRALQVEYGRFARARAPEELRIRVPGQAVSDGRVRMVLPQAFLDRIELKRIQPEPESVDVRPGGNGYDIVVGSDAGPVEVVIEYEHRRFGRAPVRVSLDPGPAVAFEQWVYP